MQAVKIDPTDRRILEWLQKAPGINAAELGEKIGLSQSAVWRRIQSLRDEGVIKDQPVNLDRAEVLDCYVLLGSVDYLLRIVTEDIKAYERFFFEKLSQLPGIQEVNSSIVLSDIKHTTVLPI
jgi:Lrp/AsnC family transcriptional regulator